ncbi:hypothetical protein N5853_13430 [Bartonella sp. HY329]|uniref:hypothetical protein n=1 Tax=unclassified Bartonella TaxID=2645622 RepID=UPI0021C9FEDB|nr:MULTISPECIES: hypothetical protein [unclassified Bartonella]UXM95064.1 hypothetical protein N5853_13430 [Bartonella sp. HY329]UXN09387.1 hypothetical protein N5852_13435 [Bartonella sp. HY328]
MVKICCFHTAKSNVALYDEAALAANDALKADYQNIVLVQSSMMKAAKQINHPQVLTSPYIGLKAILHEF